MGIQDEIERLRRELEERRNTRVNVALFGQPGAGKSSLINELVGSSVAKIGVATDTTVEIERYEHEGLVLVDLPGFDTARFPKQGYWERFQLDAMDLLLCVFAGKLHAADVALFGEARAQGKTCIFVRNQSDSLFERGKTEQDLQAEVRTDIARQIRVHDIEVVFTSCKTQQGIDELQTQIASNLAPAKRERWELGAAAHTEAWLERKREACRRDVAIAAAISALNALNPVPGVDIAVDLATLAALLAQLRASYGLTDERIGGIRSRVPMAKPLIDQLVRYGTREGLLALLRRFAGQEVAKHAAKYVPFVGQAVAAAVGVALTLAIGNDFLETCHAVAQEALRAGLTYQDEPH